MLTKASLRRTQAEVPLLESSDISYIETVKSDKGELAATINQIKAEILSNRENFKTSQFDLNIGELSSICVTHDQKYAIIGAKNSIAIFEIHERQVVYIFENAHQDQITSLATTKTDSFLISGSCDRSIKVWDLKTRELFYALENAHNSKISSIVMAYDDKLMISSSQCDITVWKFKERQALHTIKQAHEKEITALKLNMQKDQIVSVSADKSFKVWKLGTWELVSSFGQAHTSGITSLGLTKDGHYLITTSQDGSMSMWDIEKRSHVNAFSNIHKSQIQGVVLTENDKFIICASRDKSLSVWDLEAKTHLHSFTNLSEQELTGLATTRRHLLSISKDGNLYLTNLFVHRKTYSFENLDSSINDLKITKNDQYIVSASLDGLIQIWDISSKKYWTTFEKEDKKGFWSIDVSSDSQIIVSGCSDGSIDLWSLPNKKHLCTLEKFHRGEVTCVAFTKDDSKLVSCCTGKTICVWDVTTKALMYRIEDAHEDWVSSIVVSGDEKCLISASYDKSIKVWDFNEKHCIQTFENAHTGIIRTLKLTHDDKLLASASDDGTIRLWDFQTRRPVRIFSKYHKGRIYGLSISKDNQYMVAGDDNHGFAIYSLTTRQHIYSFTNSSQLSKYVTMTSDNEWIIFSNNKSLELLENPVLGLTIINSNDFSPFSPFRFMPLITYLSNSDIESRRKLIKCYSDLRVFPYSWNWLHIASIFSPAKEIISTCLELQVPFEIDIFGRTPLHYLLNNKNKDLASINNMIGKLPSILASHPSPYDLLDSMSDILYQIIELHSPQVIQFLQMCVREPEAVDSNCLELFGSLSSGKAVNYHLSDSRVYTDQIKENLGIKEGTDKLVIRILPFHMHYSNLSDDMHHLVRSLKEIDSQQVFEIRAVSLVIDYLWRKNRNFHCFLGVLFSINAVLISFYSVGDYAYLDMDILIIFFGLFFLTYELFEIITSGLRDYLSHFWNYVDMFGNLLLPATLISIRLGIPNVVKDYLFSLVIAYYYWRWISYFRIFKQTRRLVRILIEIIKDIRSFLVLLAFITIGFALVFQQFDRKKSFKYYFLESYDIIFSDFDASTYSIGQMIYFIIVTIAAPIILLNMLIAIMTETYSKAQLKAVLSDSKELLILIEESMNVKRGLYAIKKKWRNIFKGRRNQISRVEQEDQELTRILAKKKYMFFVEKEKDLFEDSSADSTEAPESAQIKEVSQYNDTYEKSNSDDNLEERLKGIEKTLTGVESGISFRQTSFEEKDRIESENNNRIDQIESRLNNLERVGKNVEEKLDLLLSMMKKQN